MNAAWRCQERHLGRSSAIEIARELGPIFAQRANEASDEDTIRRG